MDDNHLQLEHELGLLQFIVSARRDRYAGFLSNPKRRRKFTETLGHFRDWDPRHSSLLSGPSKLPNAVLEVLRSMGAPDTAWRVCYYKSDDAQSGNLDEFVRNSHDSTVLSAIPGRLALYIGEYGEVVLLHRK